MKEKRVKYGDPSYTLWLRYWLHHIETPLIPVKTRWWRRKRQHREKGMMKNRLYDLQSWLAKQTYRAGDNNQIENKWSTGGDKRGTRQGRMTTEEGRRRNRRGKKKAQTNEREDEETDEEKLFLLLSLLSMFFLNVVLSLRLVKKMINEDKAWKMVLFLR